MAVSLILLSNLENIFIAPNQSFYSGLTTSDKDDKLNENQFTITIEYLDNYNRKQSKDFPLNVTSAELSDHVSVAPTNSTGVERALYLIASEYFAGRH